METKKTQSVGKKVCCELREFDSPSPILYPWAYFSIDEPDWELRVGSNFNEDLSRSKYSSNLHFDACLFLYILLPASS